MGGAVAVGALELQHDLAGAIALSRSLAMAGRVMCGTVFEFFALMGAPAHRGM